MYSFDIDGTIVSFENRKMARFYFILLISVLLLVPSQIQCEEEEENEGYPVLQQQKHSHYYRRPPSSVEVSSMYQEENLKLFVDDKIDYHMKENNSVLAWSHLAIKMYSESNQPLWEAIRYHAILHDSIDKALSSTGCRNKNKKHVENISSCSKQILDMVIGHSAHMVLTALFPGSNEDVKAMMKDTYSKALTKSGGGNNNNQQENLDMKHARYLGETAASQVLYDRYLKDGSLGFIDYNSVMGMEGRWSDISIYCKSDDTEEDCSKQQQSTPPLNRFVNSRTYSYDNGVNITKSILETMVGGGPPSITDNSYSYYHTEVMKLGGSTVNRTEDEMLIIRFHDSFMRRGTALSMWVEIASRKILERHKDTATATAYQYMTMIFDTSSLMNLITRSLYDTLVMTSKMKTMYDTWRPVTAINKGVTGNPTVPPKNENWRPTQNMLFDYSYDQEYPSLYSACTSSFTNVMKVYFGSSTGGGGGEDEDEITIQREDDVYRTYSNLNELKNECSKLGILTGAHFGFSTKSGERLGESVSNNVYKLFCRGNYCTSSALNKGG